MVSEMTTCVWNFGSEAIGLQFSIQYDQASNTFTVHCDKGYLDLNAIWLASDSVTGTYSLTKSESSLNMNGANTVWDDGTSSSSKIVWDDFIALSSTGLGSEGIAKSTFISEGETASFSGSCYGFDAFDPTIFTTLGVRATSTSTNGDGIKWVDADGTVVDTTAPDAPVITGFADDSGAAGDARTNDATPTLTIHAEASSTVEVFRDGDSVGFAIETATPGVFSFTSAALIDGSYDFTATATDAASNTSAASAALNISVDTVAAAPNAPDLDAASDSGSSDTDNITNDNTPTVSGGGAEAGATVTLYEGATVLGSVVADGSGNWTITSSALTDGTHSLTVEQTDIAGNPSAASAALNISVDTQAPTDIRLTISSALIAAVIGNPNNNGNNTANVSTGQGTLIGTLSAAESAPGALKFSIVGTNPGDRFVIDGNQLKLAAGKEIKEGDAPFTLTLKATDLAGNEYYETFSFKAGIADSGGDTLTGTNAGGAGTSVSPVVGDDILFGFRGPDTLNVDGVTLTGTSGDDALFGGRGGDLLLGGGGNDQLFAGEGNDQLLAGEGDDRLVGGAGNDVLSGGSGNDQFRMLAPSQNGTDTTLDFRTGANTVALQQGGDGWNAAGSNPAPDASASLASSDYIQTRSAISNMVADDSNKVVEMQANLTTAQINGGAAQTSADSVNAYIVLFNSTSGRGELWYDSNWGDNAARVQVATFDDITELSQLLNLSNNNFSEWA